MKNNSLVGKDVNSMRNTVAKVMSAGIIYFNCQGHRKWGNFAQDLFVIVSDVTQSSDMRPILFNIFFITVTAFCMSTTI